MSEDRHGSILSRLHAVRAGDAKKIAEAAKGVYAWYPPTPYGDSMRVLESTEDHFYSRFSAEIRFENARSRHYDLTIAPLIKEFAFDRHPAEVFGVSLMSALLLFPVLLGGPLYVGKAVGEKPDYGIRNRIAAEMNDKRVGAPIKEAIRRARFTDAFSIRDCWILYLDIGEYLADMDRGYSMEELKMVAEWLEKRVFSLGFPWLNEKEGT